MASLLIRPCEELNKDWKKQCDLSLLVRIMSLAATGTDLSSSEPQFLLVCLPPS